MKTLRIMVFVILISATEKWCNAQGSFQNLDFESANVLDIPPGQFGGEVSTTDAMPGWQAYYNGQQANVVLHNDLSLGSPFIALFGPSWDQSQIFQGKYSIDLNAGRDQIPTAIAQAGTIPASANSFLFEASNGALSGLQVTFDGHPISLYMENSHPNYDVLAGDISDYSGETGELRFTTISGTLLDRITFSSEIIPEPASISIVLCGLGLLGWQYSRKRLCR